MKSFDELQRIGAPAAFGLSFEQKVRRPLYCLVLCRRNAWLSVSFAWEEPEGRCPCDRKFRRQYVGTVPAIELIGEIQFHAV